MILDDHTVKGIIFGSGALGGLVFIIWLGIVIYLKKKWLSELEDILDNGCRTFSGLGLFFAGQGVLRYATVFLWRFHAKRFGMLEKREKVPKHIQRWFILAFFWFMTSVLLFFGSAAVLQIYS
ncbi:hypothetical protein MSP8886_02725 [Marinomonas spartinae]|uniref:Uncharacterized protein n=1 Tax=Marinomonas spartinae TaxID=1792290 RepID=A0A1A8TLJ6_9GAMM|nr:hypothetical protein [Marinomonas spartinae]SBS33348.1 hypothetical protein MSP8886_02725 [Marinomonas spartinae]